jgi:hypothetical protein
MNRQEVLRVNPSVFVAYVFPGVLWTSFVDGRDGQTGRADGTGTFASRRRSRYQLRLSLQGLSLHSREKESELAAIRRCTYTGRPLGTAEFIGALEKKMLRRLKLLKGGRPGKPTTDSRQSQLTFGA